MIAVMDLLDHGREPVELEQSGVIGEELGACRVPLGTPELEHLMTLGRKNEARFNSNRSSLALYIHVFANQRTCSKIGCLGRTTCEASGFEGMSLLTD